MAVSDSIDLLRGQLPDLFRDRPMPPDWDDDWMIIPLDQPESVELLADVEQEALDAAERVTATAGATLPSFGEPFGGSPRPGAHEHPPPDALAFYLPFHYFHPQWWGIYLTVEGTQKLRDMILNRSNGAVSSDEAMLASRLFLYGHEAYHHAVEAFATRFEIIRRKALYRVKFEEFYRYNLDTEWDAEEALATAAGLRKALLPFKTRIATRRAVRLALVHYIQSCPLGYSLGAQLERPKAFKREERSFAETNYAFALNAKSLHSDLWTAFPHAFTGISRIASRVNYIVHRRSPIATRLRVGLRYVRLREVQRVLRSNGCTLASENGPHSKWRTAAGKSIPVPRHRDIPKATVQSILKEAGLTGRLEDMLQTV